MLRKLVVLGVLLFSSSVQAQTYPTGEIRASATGVFTSDTATAAIGNQIIFRFKHNLPMGLPVIYEWFVDGVSIGFDSYEIALNSIDPSTAIVTAVAYDMMFDIIESSGTPGTGIWLGADKATPQPSDIDALSFTSGLAYFTPKSKVINQITNGRVRVSGSFQWDGGGTATNIEGTSSAAPNYLTTVNATFGVPNIAQAITVASATANSDPATTAGTQIGAITFNFVFWYFDPGLPGGGDWVQLDSETVRAKVTKVNNSTFKVQAF